MIAAQSELADRLLVRPPTISNSLERMEAAGCEVLTYRGWANVRAGEVDAGARKIRSFDDIELDYDLLVTVPTNMGDEAIDRSGNLPIMTPSPQRLTSSKVDKCSN